MPRNRQNTSNSIKLAAATLLLRGGFENWGINAIARQAGVDKVLIYRYFESLDGLLQTIIKDTAFWPNPDDLDSDTAEKYLLGTVKHLDCNKLWSLLITLPRHHSCHATMAEKALMDLKIWMEGVRNKTTGSISDSGLQRLAALLQFGLMGPYGHLSVNEIWDQVSPPLTWNTSSDYLGFEELPTELL